MSETDFDSFDVNIGSGDKQSSKVLLSCETCRKPFWVPSCRSTTARYCSVDCYKRSGSKNPMFGKQHTPEAILQMREKAGRSRGPINGNYTRNPNLLYAKSQFMGLFVKGLTTGEIAEKLGISPITSSKWRRQLGLPRRWSRRSNRSWGSSTRKLFLLKRGHKCERCGFSSDPAILHIHHKDRNRRNNAESNLEILCPNCHETEHHGTRTGKWAYVAVRVEN